MVGKKYVPKRGDIVWLDFSPTEGHEQGGRRPSLVLSPEPYNDLIGLAIVCPITQKSKGYNFEVAISVGKIQGVVLSDHVKSVAYKERKIKYIGQISEKILEEVVQKIIAVIGTSSNRDVFNTNMLK